MAEKSVLKLFNELIESLNDAEGATSQLIHSAGHPAQFLAIRDGMGLLKEMIIKIAPHNVLLQPKLVYTERKH